MSNNIGYKKFWEILEKAGYHKDIWGYEGILNCLVLYNYDEADRLEKKDSISFEQVIEHRNKTASIIFDELKKIGYVH